MVITTTDTTETSRPLEFINTSAGDDATPVVGIHIPTDEITLPTPEASSPTVSISSSFDSDGAVIMSVAAQSPDENREIATPPEADRSITSRFFSPESTVEVSINSLPVDLRVPVLSVVEQVIKVIQQPLLSASTRLPQVEPGLQSMPPHHAIVLEIRPISFDSKIAGERVARTGFEIRLIGEYARKERPSMESFKTELHKGFIATGFSVEEPQKSERGPLGRGNEPSLAFFIFPSPSLISLLRTEKMVTNPPVASREYSDQGGEGSSKDSSQDEDHQHQQDDEDSLST
ncbi:MAG: hypothetical protein HY073_03445 [Deltaproteobacteria bacterium]|nr:hypothetical protein [Deltaproteobacteria bacterium]